MYVSGASGYSGVINADLRSQIGVAVARKTLDVAEAQGAAAVDMIRAAVDTGERAMRVTPSKELAAARGPISATPGSGEAGRRLDVTA